MQAFIEVMAVANILQNKNALSENVENHRTTRIVQYHLICSLYYIKYSHP